MQKLALKVYAGVQHESIRNYFLPKSARWVCMLGHWTRTTKTKQGTRAFHIDGLGN